ncbi:MAG TPA: hypothetical protein VGC41_01850, partial [Kofleriaceae bacterium]
MRFALLCTVAGCELFVSVPNGQLANGGDDASPDGGIQLSCAACEAPTPACDTATGTCVECVVSADCTSAAKATCDHDVCRGCIHDAECTASNVCMPDGSCADPGRVLYAATDGTAATCTAAAPCSLDTAVTAVTATQDIIHLAAGTYPRTAMTTIMTSTILAGEGAVMT